MRKNCVLVALLSLTVSAGACVGASKSANPLSPAIAGPIEGVGIIAPTVVEPAIDALVNTMTQPITLKVGNAVTSGVRPLTYRFEIATDPGFTNMVVAQANVPQGAGVTSLTLPAALAPERKYYWHARAEDGANTSLFSGVSAFSVFTPVVLGIPTLLSPINDVNTGTTQPRFLMANAPHSGPVGTMYYLLEVSRSSGFEAVYASWQILETASQTELTAPVSLSTGQYFWRARAHDDRGNTGVYSGIQAFRTLSSPGGGGGPIINPGGSWEGCGSTPGPDIVSCVHAAINQPKTVEGAFEMTKRVAWLLRGHGYGLLRKDGGENIVSWNGTSFAAARIVLADGHLYKLMFDVPNGGPQWADEGVDPGLRTLWIAPMQP